MAGKLKIFISYSRDDTAFADELAGGLEIAGYEPTLDRHSIHEGEDWKKRLAGLIADADTIVFVLSPASARSPVCAWEVETAAGMSKRILPVQATPLDDVSAPPRLAALNYVRFDEGHSFTEGIKALVRAISTDLDWLREHTRLLVRASEWAGAGRTANRLLSGSDITAAKAWMNARPSNAPPPSDLHVEFIKASEVAEEARQSEERRQIEEIRTAQAARTAALASAEQATREKVEASRRLVMRTAAGLVVALLLAALAGGAWYYARQQRQLADARAADAERERNLARQAEVKASQAAAAARKAETRASGLVDLLVRNLDVGWARNDARSPDYRHLSGLALAGELRGKPFRLDRAAVERLLRASQFEPGQLQSKIVLALRGAVIGQQPAVGQKTLALHDARPDHQSFRSVVVVVDMKTGTLSGFPGSTVPNQQFMRAFFLNYVREEEMSIRANLLPTGLYVYRFGTHGGNRVRPALRLTKRERTSEDGDAAIRRTLNDLVYDVDDIWEHAIPYDNLHVSFYPDKFSSAGSLTIRGLMSNGKPTLDYAQFFAMLGEHPYGTRVDIVLVTGLEAAIHAAAAAPTSVDMRRLRQGSQGPLVNKLQAALGMKSTGFFGPITTMRLAEVQKAKLGWSDGIYAPEMDRLLGLDVLGLHGSSDAAAR